MANRQNQGPNPHYIMEKYELAEMARMASSAGKGDDTRLVSVEAMEEFYRGWKNPRGSGTLAEDPIISSVLAEANTNMRQYGDPKSTHLQKAIETNSRAYQEAFLNSTVEYVMDRASQNGYQLPETFKSAVSPYKEMTIRELAQRADRNSDEARKAATVFNALGRIENVKFRASIFPKLLKQFETSNLEALAQTL